MVAIIQFFSWTLLLYWMHRIAHVTPVLYEFHRDHHLHISTNLTAWHWNNLFLFNDTWMSTIDLWLTEVIPTVLFAWAFNAWWLAAFYYVWAAFLQENLEHNRLLDWYPLTCGKWHMIHHRDWASNFGLFFPLWDKVFKTESWTIPN